MRISGIIEYNSNEKIPYYIGIPELEIHSQGKTIEEAYKMILDAFGILLEEHTGGKVSKKDLSIVSNNGSSFDIATDKIKEVSAFVIHRLRAFSDLSQEEVISKMGKTSRNSLTAYEYAKSEAGLTKFQEILSAIGYDIKFSFIPKNHAG